MLTKKTGSCRLLRVSESHSLKNYTRPIIAVVTNLLVNASLPKGTIIIFIMQTEKKHIAKHLDSHRSTVQRARPR